MTKITKTNRSWYNTIKDRYTHTHTHISIDRTLSWSLTELNSCYTWLGIGFPSNPTTNNTLTIWNMFSPFSFFLLTFFHNFPLRLIDSATFAFHHSQCNVNVSRGGSSYWRGGGRVAPTPHFPKMWRVPLEGNVKLYMNHWHRYPVNIYILKHALFIV